MKSLVKQPYVQKVLKSIATKDLLFQQFAEISLARFSEYALSQLSISDIRTLLDNSWSFIQNWDSTQSKLNLHNVSILQSPNERGTVIQILTQNIPFVADSIITELRRRELDVNFILKCSFSTERSAKKIKSISHTKENASEMLIHIELRQYVPLESLNTLEVTLFDIIEQISKAVDDFETMRAVLKDAAPLLSSKSHTDEAGFIEWISQNYFIFLGALRLTSGEVTETLGVFKDTPISADIIDEIVQTSNTTNKLIWLHKPSHTTIIDRNEPLDIFRVKISATEELVFLGLLTYSARSVPFTHIPYANKKIKAIESSIKSGLDLSQSLDVLSVINQLPLVEIVNSDTESLVKICQSVLNHRSKYVVLTHDRFDENLKQAYLLIFANQEKLTETNKKHIINIIQTKTNAEALYQDTYLIDNNLNCLYVVLKNAENITKLTQEIADETSQATLSWEDQLRNELIQKVGLIEADLLSKKYQYTFDNNFKVAYTPIVAASDVLHIENILSKKLDIDVTTCGQTTNESSTQGTTFHLRIFKQDASLVLSDIFAMLNSLDLSLFSESSYEISLSTQKSLWIHDLHVGRPSRFDLLSVTSQIKEVSTQVLLKQHSYDNLNSLSITNGLTYRQIVLIKTFLSYLKQIQFPFGGSYTRDILLRNSDTLGIIVALFEAKFNPNIEPQKRIELIERLTHQFNKELTNLNTEDEDKLFRQLYNLVTCILRTNFYVKDSNNNYKPYISIKIESINITDIPKPAPMAEIFVYSKDFEAVHLRSGKVARGGIRWSDRGEDYRTEVLGLTKAQNTKNSVIIPQGAKGGFYVKELNPSKEKAIQCYQNMVRAFLDITDNIIRDVPKHPENVVCYDKHDPYFVVAADKGTATFSDIANNIASEYQFWLKDAFASGGSEGYDHKKMGITSKGAWESVKAHCKEALNLNPEEDIITAVGIGDMSGDVFGNGLLSSKTIQLKAAFNHKHIFIDPNPNPKQSYEERLRLFNLPHSNWSDYSEDILSKGGMIIDRHSKTVTLSQEATNLLSLKSQTSKPTEIIRAILRLQVDLMWMGGIGTYIKASHESNESASDRINDPIRINGSEVSAKVIGEGANLGITQLGRVEFERLQQGRINTDFIDNSGGVDCSDHEVNIKILLNKAVEQGILTQENRNALLRDMTPAIVKLVTKNNQHQNLALTFASALCKQHPDEFIQLNQFLIVNAGLNNKIEHLPSYTELMERKKSGVTFTRPELAVLISYAKNHLKNEILNKCNLESGYVLNYLHSYFPQHLVDYKDQIHSHPLKSEIIATQISNEIINRLGLHFINRLMQQTGASIPDIINAYIIVKSFFELSSLWNELDNTLAGLNIDERMNIINTVSTNVYLACTWILNFVDPSTTTESYVQRLDFFLESVQPSEIVLSTPNDGAITLHHTKTNLSQAILGMQQKLTTVYLSLKSNCLSSGELKKFEKVFYELYSKFPFDAIATLLKSLTKDNYWQDLFVLNTQLDLMRTHVDLTQAITISILTHKNSLENILNTHKAKINWLKANVDAYGSQPIIDPAGITLLSRYISNLATSLIAQLEKEL